MLASRQRLVSLASLLWSWSVVVGALWPMPHTISTGTQTLLLSYNFTITAELASLPRDLSDAISRTTSRLFEDRLGRLVINRGASDAASFSSSSILSSLNLVLNSDNNNVSSISAEAVVALDERDESYELDVPADGRPATLRANSSLGLFRGLTTFEQLWYTFEGQVYAVDMPMHVLDKPAFVRLFFSSLSYDTASPVR